MKQAVIQQLNYSVWHSIINRRSPNGWMDGWMDGWIRWMKYYTFLPWRRSLIVGFLMDDRVSVYDVTTQSNITQVCCWLIVSVPCYRWRIHSTHWLGHKASEWCCGSTIRLTKTEKVVQCFSNPRRLSWIWNFHISCMSGWTHTYMRLPARME